MVEAKATKALGRRDISAVRGDRSICPAAELGIVAGPDAVVGDGVVADLQQGLPDELALNVSCSRAERKKS